MAQLPLPLAYREGVGEADYFVSDANADAVAWLDRWPDWPQPQTLLIGPPASGKSHLARLFAARTGATLSDDAEAADPEALFHAWNAATTARPLLILARKRPAEWGHGLPDLASRLAATPLLAIRDPDDRLLAAVLAKRFTDRGLRVAPEVAAYILARIERSFAGVAAAVEALDGAALEEGRGLTIPLARTVLEAQFDLPLEP
ncbi:chromosomal replication initiator DnaA [Sphingosinicellaceae bacterium]|nr:chromosomal replication initiator DnaA [Sphingosinicellaceae bacterium]